MTTISGNAGDNDYQNRGLNRPRIPPFWRDSVVSHKPLELSRQKSRHFGGMNRIPRQLTQIKEPDIAPG